MSQYKVAVFIGSLRKEAFSRKTANALIELAPGTLALEIINIGDLQIYNQDLDETPPEQWTVFRDKLRPFDGVLFVTPEYNRSVPAVLKNAIDIGSRPHGKSVWDGKPGAVVSVSPGSVGGFGANHHLRQTLVFINVPALAQPEVYLGGAAKLFDEGGKLVNDSTREFLRKFMEAFAGWVETNVKKK